MHELYLLHHNHINLSKCNESRKKLWDEMPIATVCHMSPACPVLGDRFALDFSGPCPQYVHKKKRLVLKDAIASKRSTHKAFLRR